MALQTRGDGTGAAFQINSNWFNDFNKALTGVMTDQAYKFNYRPGSGTTPVFTLDGDGTGLLIKGLKTDHATQAFGIDSNGNLSIAGTLTGLTSITMNGALSGATTGAFSGAVNVGSLASAGGVSGTTGTFSGQVQSNSKSVLANYTGGGSDRVYIQAGDPGAGAAGAGAVWIDLSVDLG